MTNYRKGYVYIKDIFAGIIEENENGYRFVYDDNYYSDSKSTPVSLTMTLKNKQYESKTLFSFFDGLIPEGWLLNQVSTNWKLNIEDRFGILLVSCNDSVGAVSISEEKS